ncbi:MAG: lipocalin family protein [Cyclobacteriaceae bacterium]|nr:lipocalin family protein [Cyclobacteriaceae bacterium]
MKKLNILILGALFFGAMLVSCNDDEKKINHPIVGTWTLLSESASDCTDPLNEYEDTYTCTPDECVTVTFKSNGKFVITYLEDGDEETEQGTYTISGTEITLCYPDVPPDCETISFVIDGLTLTTTGVDEFDGCTYTSVLIK